MTLILKIHQLEEFYQRWIEKANEYSSDQLSDYFDRFFTLFVIYNRIYNVINTLLRENGSIADLKRERKIKSIDPNDNESATTCIAYFLRDNLEQIVNENKREIEAFRRIISEHQFNITLKRGLVQRHEDIKLLIKLESKDTFRIVEALLMILYQIRCNVFHAEKGYEHDQISILAPANQSINYFNDLLMTKIRELEQTTLSNIIIN